MVQINKYVLYTTECGHINRLPVGAMTGTFSCARCRIITVINGVHEFEWHALCLHVKCRFSAWTGLSEQLANEAANRHGINTSHMEAGIEYAVNPVAARELKRLRESKLI